MLAELRVKSQITIPKEIVKSLGLAEGDKFEVFEKDGTICLVPVAVYPKRYMEELKTEVALMRERIETGEQPVFDDVDDLFAHLEAK